MKRISRLATIVIALLLAGSLVVPFAGAAPGGNGKGPNSDAASNGATVDTGSALVQLAGNPLATDARTKPAPGKKIDFNRRETRSVKAELAAQRNAFKQWLRKNAPNAKDVGEYDLALNAVAVRLNGTSLDTLAAAPMVVHAEYEGLYYPTRGEADPDLGLIDPGPTFVAGTDTAGAGVKVAVVDTGIDQSHPCFDDTDYPDAEQLGDKAFTNNKVIVAKVFNNKAGSRGYTPEAIQDHGTHVAGTIACNADTEAAVDGVAIPYKVSGVAPAALLGNYNVFPGDVDNARSEDILNALEAAYADGMDVANMSLGGGSHGVQDLLTMAVDNLDMAGMVVAVAAGNSGPGHYTVESPGMAARALTAGASTVGHFVGTSVTVENVGIFGAAAGDFPTVTTDDFTYPLGVVLNTDGSLSTACSAVTDNLTGKIALISRGTCTFSTKILNAEKAGAVAVLVVNNVAGDPTAMGSDGTPNQPTIPAYMVSLADKDALIAADTLSTTISAAESYFGDTGNENIMAGFSSQGPTDVDFRVKPDVVAPGVNVLSSIPMSYCDEPELGCWAFFQGTSMATPHLAGTAAVVIGEHGDWTAAQVRSAIVNTAVRDELTKYTDGTTPVNDVNITGAGLENVPNAVNAAVALDPVSISFGAVPSGSGQTKTFTVTLTDLGGGGTYNVAIAGDPGAGVTFTVDKPSVTLSAGGSATVTVTMSASKGADKGDYQAWLNIGDGGSVAHAAVYVFLK